MKISYPLRDTNGKELCALDDVMRLIDGEAHGTWLLGANGLWHGGIHISDVSNPFSALKPDAVNTEEPLPLQFMADGTVVAYRINNEYQTAPYCGQQLRYSSSFVLVKSQCKPDPQKEKSWLEFYSLYMHLAPVADYPKSPCYKVRDGHSGILLRQYKNGQYGLPEGEPDNGEAGTYPAPAKTKKSLSAGDRFVSSRTGRFYVTKNGNATLTTFGLVRLLKDSVPGKEQYWVTLDPVLVEPDGEIQGLMPEWMQKAKQKGAFDAVELTEGTEEWKVSAGTPVGFMGCMESPGEGNQLVDREWFVHLEVLSTDSRMPGFLANPACVKGEKKSVLAPKGKSLFTRQDAAGQPVFTPTSARLGAQCQLSRGAATPVSDESQKWWYKVSGSGWLPQNDVEEVNQYDLEKLGFQALEESSGGDVMNSPYESWIPQAFGAISRTAEQGAGYQYGLVPQFYRDLMAGMDSNRDGKVTAEEIRQALAVREPLVKNVVNRVIVKHHSEWYGGRSTGRWEGFYKDLDSLEVKYCEKWQADLEWMSKVPPFDKDEAVWHFHPVVFLNALSSDGDQLITYEQLKLMLPSNRESEINTYLEPLNETMRLFEINTPLRKSHFMAQILHETSFFRDTEETASGNAYEGRSDLGNTQIGDGPLFKGRGLLQITGRDNYTKCQGYLRGKLNDETFDITSSVSKAKQLSENPRYAALASGYFWKYIKPKLNDTADRDDVYWVSVYVNGWAVQEHPYYPDKAREPNHMDDRINKLSIAKNAFGLE
ncbi:glycoside hydrolase family 19 protein [Klebsiella variicola]|uniref:glycoside hydrolase family 19 protein n=2 Tax=Klebsiella variicola TaxID=244366 RepID=UPI0035B69369